MNIMTYSTREEMNIAGAGVIAGLVLTKPRAVIGLATGSTPVGIYEELAKLHRRSMVSFRQTIAFNLDEYIGLPEGHQQSYASYMFRYLYQHLDIPEGQRFIPNGNADDWMQECAHYDSLLERVGPIDLQLLGLGHNGHIGFNEPNDTLIGNTHLVTLHEKTREANSRFFRSIDEVPMQALTMGIGSIMKSKTILLVANGADKAEIVRRALTGPITTQCPASLLQAHPCVTVLLSEGAGAAVAALTSS